MKKITTNKRWCDWEDELIKQYYPIAETNDLLKYLPAYRNKKSVKDRAHRLGVKKNFGIKQKIPEKRLEQTKMGTEKLILRAFYHYIYQVKNITIKYGLKPDVDKLLKTFRENEYAFQQENQGVIGFIFENDIRL